LAPLLAERGVDLIDISSGGNHKLQKIKPVPFVQASFAEVVRKELNGKMLVSAVGGITDGKSAQSILDKGQADAIFVGRHFQVGCSPSLPFHLSQ
jgi:2,4-dienoyl-CoA reductase-like NADH-dependent reductase (Old Yellow Enzyme family)